MLPSTIFTTCAKVGIPDTDEARDYYRRKNQYRNSISFLYPYSIPCPLVFFVLRSCYAKDSKKGQSLRYRFELSKNSKLYLEFYSKGVSDALYAHHNSQYASCRNHELLKRYICIEKLKYFPIQIDRSFE